MATRMQQRRGTASQWISTNQGNGPILSAGEIGFESDTNKFKIGDGINHWINLTYFTDADSITTALNSIIDGAPAALNTLNELAAALGDDANFLASLATESYVDTAIGNIDALPAQSTNGGKFLTTDGSAASWATVDLTSKQDVVSGVSSTEIGYLDGVTSGIQGQLDNKLESSDLAGLATETYVDTAIGNAEVDQSELAGEGLEWNAVTSQFDVGTLTSPTISTGLTLDGTGDFTISADANIILDATTEVYIGSASSGNEVATKSYADAAAAAIVDSAPGTLNTLNELAAAINDDASYAATITTSLGNKQDKVSGVSDTEIGYLDGVTSAIQTQLNDKQDKVSGVSDTEIGYLDGVTSSIQTQLNDKSTASKTETLTNKTLTTPVINGPTINAIGQTPTIHGIYLPSPHTIIFEGTSADDFETTLAAGEPTADRTITLPDATGTIQLRVTNVSDTEIGYLDGVTSAIQTQLDAKIAKADINAKGVILVGTGSGTYAAQSVGTNGQVLTANSAQADGVEWTTISGYSAPTLGSTSIASGATVTTIAGLTLTAPTLTGTVTASGDINLSAAGGPGSLIDELTLLLMGAI